MTAQQVAKGLSAILRRRDRRAWTLVQFREADWTHGYCTGDRAAAWRFSAGRLTKVKPPAILTVPYAQFCVDGARLLVETATTKGSGQGEVFEVVAKGKVLELRLGEEGVRWRVGK